MENQLSDSAVFYEVVIRQLKCMIRQLMTKVFSFMQPAVTYLAHVIDKDGLHPTKDKVTAIVNAPPPTNVATLRSFIGLITFYANIPNHATLMAPLITIASLDNDNTSHNVNLLLMLGRINTYSVTIAVG